MQNLRKAFLFLCAMCALLISVQGLAETPQSKILYSSEEVLNNPAPMTMLPIQSIGQVCQNWCWAAVITMVNNYYGRSTLLCQPPSIKTGLNCCNWAACSYEACNHTAQLGEMGAIFAAFGINTYTMSGPINQQALVQEISSGRPVIIALYGSFAGHVVLVSGFSFADPYGQGVLYRVYDPYYGPTVVSYQNLLNSYNRGSMYWGATMLGLRPRY